LRVVEEGHALPERSLTTQPPNHTLPVGRWRGNRPACPASAGGVGSKVPAWLTAATPLPPSTPTAGTVDPLGISGNEPTRVRRQERGRPPGRRAAGAPESPP